MPISIMDKTKILALFKENDNIYYSDFCDIIKSSKTKTNNNDILNYLSEKAILELEKKEKLFKSKLSKIIYSMALIIRYSKEDNIPIDKSTIKTVNQVILKYNECLQMINAESLQTIKPKLEELKEELLKNYTPELKEIEPSEETNRLAEELAITKNLITDYEKKIIDIENNYQKLEKELKQVRITSRNLENVKQNLQMTITSLKQEINSLNQEQKTFQNQVQELLQNMQENEKTISDLNKLNSSLQIKLQTTNDKYEKLNQKLKECQNKIQNLLQDNREQEQTITYLSNLNNSLEIEIKTTNEKDLELEKKVEELLTKLSIYETKKDIENQYKQIRDIILKRLYNKPRSIEYLVDDLNEKGYPVTPQIVNEHLNALKRRVNIEGPLFETIPPIYKVNTKPLITPNPIYLPSMALDKEIDILLIADLHKDFQKDLPVKMDIAYNYSSANNIYYIFNLGDNLNNKTTYAHTDKLKELKMIEQWLKEFCDCIPKNTGIYLLNLGGNHDRLFLQVGIDPLSRFQQYRPDFINLGYNHVNIVFGNELKTDNCLAFHHPFHRLEETIGESVTENSRIKNYFSSYYSSAQNNLITRDMIYCDILAHLHRSKLDTINYYCQVPSYTRDRVANGAWHLKIYFDDQKNIEVIIFIPLIIMNNQLKPVSEIPYRKIKSK